MLYYCLFIFLGGEVNKLLNCCYVIGYFIAISGFVEACPRRPTCKTVDFGKATGDISVLTFFKFSN